MTLDEDDVYYWTKTLLRRAGVNVFGGEPPGGTNDLHRIELKPSRGVRKGSEGSRKFDLMAHHLSRFLLVELKDNARKLEPDIRKLNDTVASEIWTGRLWDSLSERGLLGKTVPGIGRQEFVYRRNELLVRCVGAPPSDFPPPSGFLLFEVDERRLRARVSEFDDVELFNDLSTRLAPYWF
jgi:hypothetical protein